MEFKTATSVLTVAEGLRQADLSRAANRARQDALYNGAPPYTAAECDQGNFDTNTNFLEGTHVLHDARLKLYSAVFGEEQLFEVKLKGFDPTKAEMWAAVITSCINDKIGSCFRYKEETRQQIASLVLHGMAPMLWPDPDSWCPTFSSMENTKFPGRTLVSLANLEYFAVYRTYTPSELYERAMGETSPEGWNKPLAKRLIKRAMAEKTESPNEGTDLYRPEQWEEDIKANSGYYNSDMVATVKTWELYFIGKDQKVFLKVVPVNNDSTAYAVEDVDEEGIGEGFLFDSKTAWAENFDQMFCLHVTDGANVPPFRLDTIRSLGYLLYSLCHLDNRIRSRIFDAIIENLCMWWRSDAGERESLPAFRMKNYGLVPQGFMPLTANERHQINEPLVMSGLQQIRQLMSEMSASFTENINNGTNGQQTATEVIAKVNAASALLSGMLTMYYLYKGKEYNEICRRFCKKGSLDPDVKEFRDYVIAEGVPEEALDFKRWKVRVNKPVGGGNQTVAMLKANQLMGWLPLYDESAQRKIKLLATKAYVDDPMLAAELVPLAEQKNTPAAQLASLSMGSLMSGIPVAVPENIAHGEFAQALLLLANVVVQRIEAHGSMATPEQLTGLVTVHHEVMEQIQIIAQDPTNKQAAKILGDQAGQLLNMIKGYAQRLQEQVQSQNGDVTPEMAAAIQKATIESNAKMQIKMGESVKKQQMKDMQFSKEEERKDVRTLHDMQIQTANTRTQIALDDAKTAAEIQRQ